MTSSNFLQIISSIKTDKHIIAGRRGSEENVKIKIILPLLEYLGYNITEDTDFELLSADIVLLDKKSKSILIIETKAWEQRIKNHLAQCLEYTLKLRTPFILITSGQQTALYSSLVNSDSLKEVEPIIEFNFKDLLNKDGEKILFRLYSLISKESILNGAKELNEASMELTSEKNLDKQRKEFFKKCSEYKKEIKTIKIDEEKFNKLCDSYSPEIRDALILAKDEFYKIANEFKNINIRYRSKEIGLEYFDSSGPRNKVLGLVGIYPERAMIAFGIEGWEKLIISKDILKKIKSFPRSVKNEKQIIVLVKLLKDALIKVKNI